MTRRVRRWGDFNLPIDNLTDKRYFETQNYLESRVSPGEESRAFAVRRAIPSASLLD
jgi:outer membrane receptor for monomeric catechols